MFYIVNAVSLTLEVKEVNKEVIKVEVKAIRSLIIKQSEKSKAVEADESNIDLKNTIIKLISKNDKEKST